MGFPKGRSAVLPFGRRWGGYSAREIEFIARFGENRHSVVPIVTLPIFSRILFMPSRRQLANAIRALSMDAVQAANSGHPGMPMGMADIAEVLWNDFMSHNPGNPKWPNRDRFVLSNGHGSMLLYSLLHLSGYALPIEQLKQFRQLHSKTAGHPEASEFRPSRRPPVRSARLGECGWHGVGREGSGNAFQSAGRRYRRSSQPMFSLVTAV